jgi:hypothetical protein
MWFELFKAGTMNDRPMDEATTKFGLLMESAQAHQKLAESHLDKLRAHTQDLDGVVRDEIRRTLVEEFQMLTAESRRAAEVLGRIRRSIGLRVAVSSIAVAILCTGIPVAITRWLLPSESDIAGLRVRRDELAASIAALERRGGHIELRHCGETARLCVHVDRSAPAYGEKADYYIVKGY